MGSKNLVICTSETDYASRLATFLCERKELAFQVKICSNFEQLLAFQGEQPADILLLDEDFAEKREEVSGVSRIIILSSKKARADDEEKYDIFKYQSGNDICAQIIQICEDMMEGLWCVRKQERGKIIGIYSPVHRVGQTTFAIKKGKEMAKRENVLYMNLEMYAGYGGHFPERSRKDLSVLLYYMKQETGNPGLILTTLVKQMGILDYIPPAMYPEDLKTVTSEEWIRLFGRILSDSIYNVLILDLSECIQGLYDILNICDTVYMPVVRGRIASAKVRQYEEALRQSGYSGVVERMIRCDIRRTASGKGSGKTGPVQGSGR